MITKHYGIYVDSDKAITGVISNNDIIQLIADEEHNGIDLGYEDHITECKQYAEDGECDCELELGTVLIGKWKKNADEKYEPDENGEYAIIIGETYSQVVFSKQTKRCALCSPCFPGQGDLDTPGDYLTYSIETDAEAEIE